MERSPAAGNLRDIFQVRSMAVHDRQGSGGSPGFGSGFGAGAGYGVGSGSGFGSGSGGGSATSAAGGAARRRVDPYRLRDRMVAALREAGVSDEAVLEAMGRVPRHLFVDEALAMRSYELANLPIGYGQTISNPRTVAVMTQLLEVRRGMRVLEVGTGSGYQAAVLVAMGCRVVTVERIPQLAGRARALLEELGLSCALYAENDGTVGYPPCAPYDRIVVTACGPRVPRPLLDQLDEGAIMVIPVGDAGRQRLVRVRRHRDRFLEEDCGPASFVDLVGEHGWRA